MARERTTPDVKTRFIVDYSQLTKAEKAIARAHGQFASGAERSQLAATALERRLGRLSGTLSKFGPVGQAAAHSLDNVSVGATAAGGALGLVGGIALASLGAVAAGAAFAENSYEKLVERIDNYQDVTGTSAEQASRQVHMFQVLGISAEIEEKAMYKLSKSIATNAGALEALGVHIQTNRDGTVDLGETLYSVADAYDATSDSSQRSLILFTAFGKGGTELIDVVKQGSARLRELADATKFVITDEEIERLREYHVRQEEMKTGWDEWWASLGQKVFPALDATQESLRRGTFVQEGLTKAVKDGKITDDQIRESKMGYRNEASKLTDELIKQFDAQNKDTHAAAVLGATMKQVADAQHAVAKETDDAVNALQAQASAQIANDRANIALTTSQDKVNAARLAYKQAVKDDGKNSASARQALADYKNAVLDQEEAYLHAADAAGKLARENHANADEQTAAKAAVDATIRQFEDEAKTLDKNSPLRKQLLGYIADLKKIPIEIATSVSVAVKVRGITYDSAANAHGNLTFAEGGRPPVGRDVIVGEHGPEIQRFDAPSTIYPNGVMPPGGFQGGGGASQVVTVHAQTNADPYEIARDVGWELRKFRRFR